MNIRYCTKLPKRATLFSLIPRMSLCKELCTGTVIPFNDYCFWATSIFYKSKCPYVCVCCCPFTFEVPLKRLFAPTSRSRMSNIFRYSESFGKSNGKKWSNIWTFLFGNGLKSPRKKSFLLLLILRVITALSRWYAGHNRLRLNTRIAICEN